MKAVNRCLARALCVLAAGALFGSAHAQGGAIQVRDAWAQPSGGAARSVPVFMTLTNVAATPDRLLRVVSDTGLAAGVHMLAVDDGVLRARRLEAVEMPSGVPVVLAPGGVYLLLEGVEQALRPRSTVTLRLVFENAGEQVVRARVRPAGADAESLDALRSDPLQQPGGQPRTEGLDDALRTDPFLR